MYVCMHACMHACMYVCMYACMHGCMYVCMYVCLHIHIHLMHSSWSPPICSSAVSLASRTGANACWMPPRLVFRIRFCSVLGVSDLGVWGGSGGIGGLDHIWSGLRIRGVRSKAGVWGLGKVFLCILVPCSLRVMYSCTVRFPQDGLFNRPTAGVWRSTGPRLQEPILYSPMQSSSGQSLNQDEGFEGPTAIGHNLFSNQHFSWTSYGRCAMSAARL